MQKILGLIGALFSRSSSFLVGIRKALPATIAGIILLIGLIGSGVESFQQGDSTIFLKDLGNTILALDYKVYEMSNFALEQDKLSLLDFLEIISSFYIFFFIILKYVAKFVNWVTGSATPVPAAYFIGILLLVVVEFASVKLINGVYFIPWSGFWFFITHFPSIIGKLSIYNIGITERMGDLINNTADPKIIEQTL